MRKGKSGIHQKQLKSPGRTLKAAQPGFFRVLEELLLFDFRGDLWFSCIVCPSTLGPARLSVKSNVSLASKPYWMRFFLKKTMCSNQMGVLQ